MSNYVAGDNWIICDVCGFKTRASESLKRWDGARVCKADFETRHPQDFVRGRYDKQRADVVRSEPPDVFIDIPDFVDWADGNRVQWPDGDLMEW